MACHSILNYRNQSSRAKRVPKKNTHAREAPGSASSIADALNNGKDSPKHHRRPETCPRCRRPNSDFNERRLCDACIHRKEMERDGRAMARDVDARGIPLWNQSRVEGAYVLGLEPARGGAGLDEMMARTGSRSSRRQRDLPFAEDDPVLDGACLAHDPSARLPSDGPAFRTLGAGEPYFDLESALTFDDIRPEVPPFVIKTAARTRKRRGGLGGVDRVADGLGGEYDMVGADEFDEQDDVMSVAEWEELE